MAYDWLANPANMDDWLTSTARIIMDEGKAQDNIYNYMGLLATYKMKGVAIEKSAGAGVTHQLRYKKTLGGKWYSGAELLATSGGQQFTEAFFGWRKVAVPIEYTGNEKRGNRDSKTRTLDLLGGRMEGAIETAKDLVSTVLSQAAARVASNQPESVDSLIGTTNTVGGISGTTYTWWQATVTASGAFNTQGVNDIMTCYLTVQQGNDGVDLLYSDKTQYQKYWAYLQPAMRYVDTKTMDAVFENLKFMGATWLADSYGLSGTVFGLKTRHIRFVAMKDANFDLNEEVRPANQDAWIRQLLCQCAHTTKIRRRHFKVTGLT